MKVALIQPDSPYLTTPLAFPNLGLLYISSFLKQNGLDVDFYDLTGEVKLPPIRADVIGFSCQITQWKSVQELSRQVEGKLVIGGPYPTHSETPGFIQVKGEGEYPMLEICTGEKREGYIDPDFFPDWEAIDLKRYGYSLEGKRCINIMTKRGNCPYRCAFCAKPEMGAKLRFRTAKHVLEEARLLKEKGFGAIAIYDDDVLLTKYRDWLIFKGLKKLNMPYRCMTRTNLASQDDLEVLKATGCAEVAIGVETCDPEIRRVISKGTTLEMDNYFIKRCKKLGLRVKAYLIIGLPGESHESVDKMRQWLKEVKPENYDVSILTPYPGSDIYKNKESYDIQWDENELQKIWYSGQAQYGSCAVSTSHLTSSQILDYSRELNSQRGQSGTTDYWKPL